jgi:7-cyano-7-deazaguanine synthase
MTFPHILIALPPSKAFSAAVSMGSYLDGGLTVISVLAFLNKRAVIALGKDLHAPLHLTWSCYDPHNDRPCTICPACRLRQDALCESPK